MAVGGIYLAFNGELLPFILGSSLNRWTISKKIDREEDKKIFGE